MPTVYWTDKLPSSVYHRFTIPVLTPRQEALSRCKMVNVYYQEDRRPLRPVTSAALRAEATPRLKELAQPRSCTDVWELNRPLYPLVSKGALSAIPSERILALAKPKQLPTPSSKPHRKGLHGPIARIARFDDLAKPRTYTFDVRNPYKISKAALEYVASPRILEISRPARVRAKVAPH
ncbi:testicular haploid expressed gene protein isoform X2 [Hemicordylus capensis]|uniref:testicular haploid expressed gene protein isoform X2 n=1 Tax=Hemicordylus capensis TaxID=884348 RepID=UPI002304CBCC|nr:testicular haploid expressed gene protein isoform X2 [Hemicordylus capensis]